jgi:HD-GYP domain-containing protein (c-di-GMP phosphodiesterase class II)
MSDPQVLLSRIAALRQQLDKAKGPSHPTEPSAEARTESAPGAQRVRQLEQQVTTGSQQTHLLDSTLRQLTSTSSATEITLLPKQLTSRARRILEHGHELLNLLRQLADELDRLPHSTNGDPLADHYRQTTAMTETVLRMLQAFPDAPSAQLRLCEGLEAILTAAAERISSLTAALRQRKQEILQVDTLADLLSSLHAGKSVDLQAFLALAEPLIVQAQEGAAVRFLAADVEQPARFIASHCLTVAQVAVRVVHYDPELRRQAQEIILASLLHDVGMLSVPLAILTQAEPLTDEQHRQLEAHTQVGADLMGRLVPNAAWLAEAALAHHERLDGTGYPSGWRERQLTSLTRLLAVCDVYAALCTPRPHRAAYSTRTALTDTLLLADQGKLDRSHAERLLQLTFYPIGSLVELSDGAVGMVVATHTGRRDLQTPARPIVALLADGQGYPCTTPRYIDLSAGEGRSIVRSLSGAERGEVLGKRYPELL